MTTQYTRAQLAQNQTWKTVRRPGLAADFPAGADFDIFTVTGVILVSQILGHVTTVIGAGALLPFLEITTVVPAATVPLCAVVGAAINADAVDTMYGWIGTIAGPLLVTPVGASQGTVTWGGEYIVLTAGVINVDTAVVGTGIIDWYITYLPMSTGAVVTIL